ncbi:putative diguanylate cyclase [Megalodesulfovibrio gigas DSM 1382 = ATCC 19364]|uniref:diguanylate cyclase n=2 Tax=Megalodesulfovibrio gigas TaxID=879 RepID=T2G8B0_MEGG1|nr:putative diguanylate cyclase [Megalodesulfovibrio gigas DSM 1382 = ATCC 19364]
MNAFALGFHEEERVIARCRTCLEQAEHDDCCMREEFTFLLGEYEKLFRQSMRLVKMGDRMQQKLATLNEALERKQEELLRLAATDMLTGLANRRAFMETAHQALSRATRHALPLSLFLVDADHFKRINDTYGHDAGDLVLRNIAVIGKASLRAEDLFARLGGEEFAALLPDADLAESLQVADRLRSNMAQCAVPVQGHRIGYTVSIGVATIGGRVDTVDRLIKAADEALYAAKAAGRNQVAAHAPLHSCTPAPCGATPPGG